MAENGLSILVMCYNNDRLIYFCLDAIQKQINLEGIPCEVLIVSNEDVHPEAKLSVDNWNLKNVPVRIIVNDLIPSRSLKFFGLKHCRYGTVAFIDDDSMITPTWASQAYRFMQTNPTCGVLCGEKGLKFMVEPMRDFDDFLFVHETGKQGTKAIDDITDSRGYVWGTGMILRKELLDQVVAKGLQSDFGARTEYISSTDESAEICWISRMMGYRIFFLEELKITQNISPHHTSFIYLQSQSRKNGETYQWIKFYTRKQKSKKYRIHPLSALLKIYFQSLVCMIRYGFIYLFRFEKKTNSKNYLMFHYYLGSLKSFSLMNLRKNSSVLTKMTRLMSSTGEKSPPIKTVSFSY